MKSCTIFALLLGSFNSLIRSVYGAEALTLYRVADYQNLLSQCVPCSTGIAIVSVANQGNGQAAPGNSAGNIIEGNPKAGAITPLTIGSNIISSSQSTRYDTSAPIIIAINVVVNLQLQTSTQQDGAVTIFTTTQTVTVTSTLGSVASGSAIAGPGQTQTSTVMTPPAAAGITSSTSNPFFSNSTTTSSNVSLVQPTSAGATLLPASTSTSSLPSSINSTSSTPSVLTTYPALSTSTDPSTILTSSSTTISACNTDDACLQQIRSSTQSCNALFQPSVITSTSTATVIVSLTSTSSTTETLLVLETSDVVASTELTVTLQQTSTDFFSTTVEVIESSSTTSTSTFTAQTTITPVMKRRQVVTSNAQCSDSAQISSACSCLGFNSGIFASASTTTTTIFTTVSMVDTKSDFFTSTSRQRTTTTTSTSTDTVTSTIVNRISVTSTGISTSTTTTTFVASATSQGTFAETAIGQVQPAAQQCNDNYVRAQSLSGPNGPSYVVPQDGYISRASTFDTTGSAGSFFTFLAWRESGNDLILIGHSDRLALTGSGAVVQFTFNDAGPINVLIGDVIGIYTEDGPCVSPDTDYEITEANEGTLPPDGYALGDGDRGNFILNVAAVVTYRVVP